MSDALLKGYRVLVYFLIMHEYPADNHALSELMDDAVHDFTDLDNGAAAILLEELVGALQAFDNRMHP